MKHIDWYMNDMIIKSLSLTEIGDITKVLLICRNQLGEMNVSNASLYTFLFVLFTLYSLKPRFVMPGFHDIILLSTCSFYGWNISDTINQLIFSFSMLCAFVRVIEHFCAFLCFLFPPKNFIIKAHLRDKACIQQSNAKYDRVL